ncbi:endolytic transglycosylase MltG [uncultured Marinobacter sp.]|mgnify:CR=1 FL=1|uniref:endolytic transglycosylase MltG n=1 Tax=uncultured Marinobacter sp. TaxID=187379 RepID=UPI0030DBAEB6
MIKTLALSAMALLVLVVAGAGLWVSQGFQALEQPVAMEEPLLFDVPRGRAFVTVARDMAEQGLVADAFWLQLYGRAHPDVTAIRSGEYEFMPGMSPLEMIGLMVSGRTKSRFVQFIEGTRFQDVRAVLAGTEHLEQLTTGWTDEEVMAALGAEGDHPEGRFFPDTYSYTRGESDLDLLRRSFERMNLVLAEEWAGRMDDLPYDNPYEALVMASIVERETGAPHERRDVAGVFVRRLEIGMRLQTDPTVIYGMGDSYQGRITRRDLRTHTPYNTYRIHGLPPTPIALPGREAINAALHPADGETLYFVARGDGTHKFSRTLEDHQRAVREFQLNRREGYRSSPAPASQNGGQ